MPQSKLRELLESLKARYPTASADELTDRFMEELRSDEKLHKAALEEVFRTHGQRARASVAKKRVAHHRLFFITRAFCLSVMSFPGRRSRSRTCPRETPRSSASALPSLDFDWRVLSG